MASTASSAVRPRSSPRRTRSALIRPGWSPTTRRAPGRLAMATPCFVDTVARPPLPRGTREEHRVCAGVADGEVLGAKSAPCGGPTPEGPGHLDLAGRPVRHRGEDHSTGAGRAEASGHCSQCREGAGCSGAEPDRAQPGSGLLLLGPRLRTASTPAMASRSSSIHSLSWSATSRTHQANASLRLRATPASISVSST